MRRRADRRAAQDLRTPGDPVGVQPVLPRHVHRGARREPPDRGHHPRHRRERHGAPHRLLLHVLHHGTCN